MKYFFTSFLLLFTAYTSFAQVKKPISKPLVRDLYTADPSAHVFGNKIYIYPSHDIETGVIESDDGGKFDMKDYHVYSIDPQKSGITDHGIALKLEDIPWASKQLWAPDAAYANGKYYLYFPAKDKNGVFRIGAATSAKAAGPFKAEPEPIVGSYSIDPSVFKDDNGTFYMYFGGIWGGQLQHWPNNEHKPDNALKEKTETAFLPRIAKMNKDMLSFAEPPREIKIIDDKGKLLLEGQNDKRFFEAAWMHKYQGKYYFSYSTGDTHLIAYAVGASPYGPFIYKGTILNPVEGWTNHHSIVKYMGRWFIFYHDTELSGQTHLRNIKMTELKYNPDGTIITINAYK